MHSRSNSIIQVKDRPSRYLYKEMPGQDNLLVGQLLRYGGEIDPSRPDYRCFRLMLTREMPTNLAPGLPWR
jgi:hypothetical protein